MYPTSTYVMRRAPSHGCRMARHAPNFTRQLSGGPGFFPPAPFWGTVHGRHGPLGGGRGQDIFDHFDDFVTRSFDNAFPPSPRSDRRMRGPPEQLIWQPRFDVSEADGAYQLRGELPGVEAKDLEVEFTDANTLIIRGKTESNRTEGSAPQQQDGDVNMTATENTADTQEATQTEKDTDAASVHSDSSYVKPTVEDEAEATARENGAEASSTAGAPTPNTDNTVAADGQEQQGRQAESEPQQPRYWVSERSLGSFQRTFSFSGRVDSESVTASLKNGILDIVVPKSKNPEARKISVQ